MEAVTVQKDKIVTSFKKKKEELRESYYQNSSNVENVQMQI